VIRIYGPPETVLPSPDDLPANVHGRLVVEPRDTLVMSLLDEFAVEAKIKIPSPRLVDAGTIVSSGRSSALRTSVSYSPSMVWRHGHPKASESRLWLDFFSRRRCNLNRLVAVASGPALLRPDVLREPACVEVRVDREGRGVNPRVADCLFVTRIRTASISTAFTDGRPVTTSLKLWRIALKDVLFAARPQVSCLRRVAAFRRRAKIFGVSTICRKAPELLHPAPSREHCCVLGARARS